MPLNEAQEGKSSGHSKSNIEIIDWVEGNTNDAFAEKHQNFGSANSNNASVNNGQPMGNISGDQNTTVSGGTIQIDNLWKILASQRSEMAS